MDNQELIFENLDSFLEYFDNLQEPFSEHTISGEIGKITKTPENEFDIKAESMAFDFFVDKGKKQIDWGTYYGPMSIVPQEGGYFVWPNIKLVTPEMIDYWERRAEKSKHPILKARYADLVWDFKKKITKQKPSHKFALMVIDSNLEIANKDLYEYDIFVIPKLQRALELSLKLKDEDRIALTKTAFFNYETKLAVDDKAGTWGFVYDSLVRDNKIATPEEEQAIIENLESRLIRITSIESSSIENCVKRLAQYYKKKKNITDLKRVLKIFEDNYNTDSDSAMRSIFLLEKIYELYLQYEFNEDAQKILRQIDELSPKVLGELKPVRIGAAKINASDIENFIDEILDGSIDQAFDKLVKQFVPRKTFIEKQISATFKENPLHSLVKVSVISNESGRKIAKLDPNTDEPTDQIIYHISQNLSLDSFFLRLTLNKLIEKFQLTSDILFEKLIESSVFSDCRKDLLQLGIKNYFDKNFIVSSHILIPQVEHAFRTVLELSGGFELRTIQSIYGGFEVKSLGSILHEDYLLEAFGEDTILYFKTLLVDHRGWNIRNNICHGLRNSEYFDQTVADRIMHVLLCLSRLRIETNDVS